MTPLEPTAIAFEKPSNFQAFSFDALETAKRFVCCNLIEKLIERLHTFKWSENDLRDLATLPNRADIKTTLTKILRHQHKYFGRTSRNEAMELLITHRKTFQEIRPVTSLFNLSQEFRDAGPITVDLLNKVVRRIYSEKDLFVWERLEDLCFARSALMRSYLNQILPESDLCNIYVVIPRDLSEGWQYHTAVYIKSLNLVFDPATDSEKCLDPLKWASQNIGQEWVSPLKDLSTMDLAEINREAHAIFPSSLHGLLFIIPGEFTISNIPENTGQYFDKCEKPRLDRMFSQLGTVRFEVDRALITQVFHESMSQTKATKKTASNFTQLFDDGCSIYNQLKKNAALPESKLFNIQKYPNGFFTFANFS